MGLNESAELQGLRNIVEGSLDSDLQRRLYVAGLLLEDCEHGYKLAGGSYTCPACEAT